MPSFDIVCEVDLQEVDNAINQAQKEIQNRFDFRGSKSSINLDKEEAKIAIVADDELKLRSIHQILELKLAKREVDLRFLNYGDEQQISGGCLKQLAELRSGLSKDDAKRITKTIKESKLKVQAQIQNDQVRVTGKKIDDLQNCIQTLKSSTLDLPLNFTNMRS